jgi:hypothetical protein
VKSKALRAFPVLVALLSVPLAGFGQQVRVIKRYPSRIGVMTSARPNCQRPLSGRVPGFVRYCPVYVPSPREARHSESATFRERIAAERESSGLREGRPVIDLSALERDVAAIKDEVRQLSEKVAALASDRRAARQVSADAAKIEALKKELRELRLLLGGLRDR